MVQGMANYEQGYKSIVSVPLLRLSRWGNFLLGFRSEYLPSLVTDV